MTDHGIADQVSQVTFTISTFFKRPIKINQSLAHNLRGIIGQVDLPGLHVRLNAGIWKNKNTLWLNTERSRRSVADEWEALKQTNRKHVHVKPKITSVCGMSSENTSRSHTVSKSVLCEERASASLVTHQHQNQSSDEKITLSFVSHWSWWMTVVTVWRHDGVGNASTPTRCCWTRESLYSQDYPHSWLSVLSTDCLCSKVLAPPFLYWFGFVLGRLTQDCLENSWETECFCA